MIKQKLEILVNSNVIDEDTHQYILQILNYFLENKLIQEEQEADVFLTHLAMADARRKKNEAVTALDEMILQQILSDSNYERSKQIWIDLQNIEEKNFEISEIDYFYLHIISLLKED